MKKLAHLISIHCFFLVFLTTCNMASSVLHADGDGKEDEKIGCQDEIKEEVTTAQENITVYHVVEKGKTIYVGITNNLDRRKAEHLRERGFRISSLIRGLSRDDARGVEQALINIHGLKKNGGTLENKINSIARTNSMYKKQVKKGYNLLQSIGYITTEELKERLKAL